MAADTYYFLLSPSACLICTSSLRWPAAIFSAECFLLVMAEDKRRLKIRSISMDFRFESPGECWALWKDSERATKGKTPKKKKSILDDLWTKGYFFSGHTYNHFCQNKHCRTFFGASFLSASYTTKSKFPFLSSLTALWIRNLIIGHKTGPLRKFPFLIYNNFSLLG